MSQIVLHMYLEMLIRLAGRIYSLPEDVHFPISTRWGTCCPHVLQSKDYIKHYCKVECVSSTVESLQCVVRQCLHVTLIMKIKLFWLIWVFHTSIPKAYAHHSGDGGGSRIITWCIGVAKAVQLKTHIGLNTIVDRAWAVCIMGPPWNMTRNTHWTGFLNGITRTKPLTRRKTWLPTPAQS